MCVCVAGGFQHQQGVSLEVSGERGVTKRLGMYS